MGEGAGEAELEVEQPLPRVAGAQVAGCMGGAARGGGAGAQGAEGRAGLGAGARAW